MTLLGWFHTVMGVIAILTAAYTLYQHRIIRAADKSGRAYLLITLVVAGSALAIYNQGGFGVGHILAVLTLTALLAGYLLETLAPFGKWSVYLQTGAYTATVLFHMIPAITDFLGACRWVTLSSTRWTHRWCRAFTWHFWRHLSWACWHSGCG